MYLEDYPKEVYQDFVDALEGDKKKFQGLLETYPEWAAFANAIRGDQQACQWLLHFGFKEMGFLALAFDDDIRAHNYLASLDDPFLFYFAQATKKDGTAIAWLEKNDLLLFVLLAQRINKVMLARIKEETFWYRIKW